MTKTITVSLERVEALDALANMVLLFHSASPWTSEKCDEWKRLQGTIHRYTYGDRPAQAERDFGEATTKVLCDCARMVLGDRHI